MYKQADRQRILLFFEYTIEKLFVFSGNFYRNLILFIYGGD